MILRNGQMPCRKKIDMSLVQTMRGAGGSVGAVWPPRYDAHNNRIKGFCPFPVASEADASRLFSAMREAESAHPASSRTTVRAFVHNGMLEGLMKGAGGYETEARVDAGRAVEGCELVYFGRNSEARRPAAGTLGRELASVGAMVRLEPIDVGEACERVRRNGYALSRLNGDGKLAVERLLALYHETFPEYTFDITRESIDAIVSNGNIVIVGRDGTGAIVSSLVAEHCEFRMDRGRWLHLYELSDYATFREHRNKGLNTMMQIEAIRAIRALHGGDAVVYAESRAAWEPVNRASRRAGLTYCGTLPQHCIIRSDRQFGEAGDYENLNVWADVAGN